MGHVNMRAFGVGLIPGVSPKVTAMSPTLQQGVQQAAAEGAAAAAVCNDGRFNTPELKSACIEAAAAASAAGLNIDQLFALSAAKVKCHGFFNALGLDVDDNVMSQCISSPDAVIGQLCATPGASATPACQQFAAPSFVKKYKTPLLIGGGLALALLIAKVVL